MIADVSRETADRLRRYVELVAKWSTVLNLVSRNDKSDVWDRHIEDSLQLISYMPPRISSFADVGSGAGFPAIPIAVATGFYVHLIEVDRRKAAFLETTLSELGIAGRVWNEKAEAAPIPRQPVCTARAVAPLAKLVPLCRRLLLPGALGIFPKGRRFQAEMSELAGDPMIAMEHHASMTDAESAVVIVRFGKSVSADG